MILSDCTNFLRGSYPCWIAARSVISTMRIINRCLSTRKVKGIKNLVPCKTEGHESEASKMIYACDSCHFLFSRVSPVKQCPDCGESTPLWTKQSGRWRSKRSCTPVWTVCSPAWNGWSQRTPLFWINVEASII